MSVKTQTETNRIDSSTSMQHTRDNKMKTQQRSELQSESSGNSLVGAEPESESPHLLSRQAQEAYENPEFKLAWQNQFRFHIARNLIRLRRYQGLSQAQLAKLMKTSQPMIARLESG